MPLQNIQTPAWVRDAVFYQIFPDRFAWSERVHKPSNLEPWDSLPTHHGFKGGDLLGVVEHLDYLTDLGINAIYFNPIFESAANHRYHTFDYYKVDPLLGGNEALRVLLDECHARGIRVILDGVFNHASRGFFQFNNILENGPFSPYIDWFRIRGWPLNAYESSRPPNYDAWWNLHALPKLNTSNPDVREFIFDVAEHWIRFGIDGWRLDVPGEIDDDEFWQEFRHRVKAANPDAYIVGEVWEDARRWLQGDQFDAVMNYLFTRLCIELFAGNDRVNADLLRGSSLFPLRNITPEQFATDVKALLGMYPRAVTEVQLNLLESHDTARFLTIAGGDESALRLATLFQMIYPGAPCIYYGSEVGMTGGRDPLSRGSFPWDESKWNNDLLRFFKKAVALRRAHPALRSGDYVTLLAQQGALAIGRKQDDDCVITAFNLGPGVCTLQVPVGELLPDGVRLRDAFKKDMAQVRDGEVEVHILPRSAVALEVTGT